MATATSTCSPSTPRRRRTTCSSASPSPTADRRKRASTCSRRSGSATPGRGDEPARATGPNLESWRGTRPRSWRTTARSAGFASTPRPPRSGPELLFTENETNVARLFGANAVNPSPYVKDAFHEYVVRGRSDAVQPDRTGTKAGWRYRLSIPPGGEVVVRLRLFAESETPAEVVRARIRRRVRRARARGRALLRLTHPRRADGGGAPRGPPGLCRPSVDEAVLPLRGEGLARRRPRAAPSAGEPQDGAQRRLAAPLQPRRHLHARQMGVPLVRGLGPRVPHGPVRADRPGVRQAAARPVSARVVHAPQRPDPGIRVRLRRRESARPCVGRVARPTRSPARGAAATASSSRASSRSCSSTSRGGSTARTPRARTSSPEDSSGSTTSASSTARASCRRADT